MRCGLTRIVPLLAAGLVAALLGIDMFRFHVAASVCSDGVFYPFPSEAVTPARLRALLARPSSQEDRAVRALVPEPPRGRSVPPTPRDAVLLVRTAPVRGLMEWSRGLGWPAPWVRVVRLCDTSDVATGAELRPVWAMSVPMIANGGRFTIAVRDTGTPAAAPVGRPGGLIADSKGVIFGMTGSPGASRSLELDIPAMATSLAVVLAAYLIGTTLRAALRRRAGSDGRWKHTELVRRLPVLLAAAASLFVLVGSLLPLREQVVRSATGHWPTRNEPAFETSLSFSAARGLAARPGGGKAIAEAVLGVLPPGTADDVPLGAGYAQPAGAVLDQDLSIWGRPGWLTFITQSRRVPVSSDDPVGPGGTPGPMFPPGPPDLRGGRPFTAIWISSGGGAVQHVIRLDVGKILLKVMMVWAAWALVRAPFAGFSVWVRHRRQRKGLCLSCGYDRRRLALDAPCPECGSPASPPAA